MKVKGAKMDFPQAVLRRDVALCLLVNWTLFLGCLVTACIHAVILWQDCSNSAFLFVFQNISEVIWLVFALGTLSPAPVSDSSLFTECKCTHTCNGQTLAAFYSLFFFLPHASWILQYWAVPVQLRVKTIIKKEFVPVMSADLLGLTVECFFKLFFPCLQIVSATSVLRPESYSWVRS